MTYPYNQPGGQQDPWGQQQGGYPQDPYGQQGYPQQDPYGQMYQQQGYPQTGGFPQPGGYGQPPKKSNTGVIVTIVAVVVIALGALGITGFVAPGFFLSDDEEEGGGGGGGGGPQSSPQALAEAIVTGINNKDANALNGLLCPDADSSVREVLTQLNMVESAQLAGPVQQVDDTNATASVTVTAQGQQETAAGTMNKQGETWCWKSVGGASSSPTTETPPTAAPEPAPEPTGAPAPGGGGEGVPGGPEVVAEQFIGKVEDGDQAGAEQLMCEEAPGSTSSLLETAIERNSKDIEMAEKPEGSGYASTRITGTNDRGDARGLIGMKSFDDGASWCVQLFSLI